MMQENTGLQRNTALMEKAYYLRHSYVEDMDTHLLNFETKATSHNLNVCWAIDEENLLKTVLDLLPSKKYNKVCVDIPDISLNLETAAQVNLLSLDNIKNHQDEADTLVVSADFAISENGSLIFVDRDSKDIFNSFRNLIVVIPIDQFLVKQKDLSIFLDLKYDNQPTDIKIVQHPFKKIVKDPLPASDSKGYTEEEVKVSVILYENSVTDYMMDPFLRKSLYCIKCGKCAQVCPVSQLNNGLNPIDIVKNNCLDSYNRTQSIFKQTTLCGNCQQVCPVKIPLTEMLIYEMQLVNENKDASNNKLLHDIFIKRSKMNKYNSPFFRFFLMKFLYGKNRQLYNYFSDIKNTFFNITQSSPDN